MDGYYDDGEPTCYSEIKSYDLLIPNGPSFKVHIGAVPRHLLMYDEPSDMQQFLRLDDKEVVIFDGKEANVEEVLRRIPGYWAKPFSLIQRVESAEKIFESIIFDSKKENKKCSE